MKAAMVWVLAACCLEDRSRDVFASGWMDESSLLVVLIPEEGRFEQIRGNLSMTSLVQYWWPPGACPGDSTPSAYSERGRDGNAIAISGRAKGDSANAPSLPSPFVPRAVATLKGTHRPNYFFPFSIDWWVLQTWIMCLVDGVENGSQ
jgi:hypothetical protein